MRERARKTLATLKPLSNWIEENHPTPETTRLAQQIVGELIKVADMTKDEEERDVRVKHGLKLEEVNNHGSS